MRYGAIVLLGSVLCAGPILAQTPSGLPGAGSALPPGILPAPTPPPLTLGQPPQGPQANLTTFDYHAAEVRWVTHHWELFANGTRIKDLGPREFEAREALRLIRDLRLTQRGTIGSPQPIMEYWLCDGNAPRHYGGSIQALPIDPASLRVEQVQGQWCVRDERRAFFNFGVRRAEAEQTLGVLRQYNFNRIGFVGSGQVPAMIYFLRDPNLSGATPPPHLAGAPSAPQAPTAMQQQILALGVRQLAPPPMGLSGTMQLDPHHLEVRPGPSGWQLTSGDVVLATFSSPQEAQHSLDVVHYYRFTERNLIGQPIPSFAYYLVNGQAPQGVRIGVNSRAFRPEHLTVQQMSGEWAVVEQGSSLVTFGNREADARELLAVIQRYRFDHLCWVGPANTQGLTFLARGH
jgi:hypothetical protein